MVHLRNLILKKFLYILGAFVAGIALIALGTLVYILSFYAQASTQQYDCAVVFGAAVWPGGNPSHALSDRTHTAIDIYNRNQVACLVFSGADSAYDKHEVDVMVDIAYEREVAFEDIELDYDGDNTKQTIANLEPERSYLLVSNDFHLARIKLFARQLELGEYGVHSSEYRHGRYTREPFFILREIAAFWYYVLVG